MDGVDGVLIDLASAANFRILCHQHAPFNADLRSALFALNVAGANELHRAALAANGVARAYGAVVSNLLRTSNTPNNAVQAIGAHGQTVRHRPGDFDVTGYTCQLLNGALLAELTGIDVICDFRSRDVAAGGQGAPLVPAFHQAAFARPGQDIAILNIGGISNITFLPADGAVSGYDCGPGNVLMDLWCHQHTGRPFDANGDWARSGQLCRTLLQNMLQDSYLQRRPPKSTGRDHFNAVWLQGMLANPSVETLSRLAPEDIQQTLTELTAQAVAQALRQVLPRATELLVCGGGALNGFLMECLRRALPLVDVKSISERTQLDPMHVEATAFAWFAQAHCQRMMANVPAVTGATGPRLLGALYCA